MSEVDDRFELGLLIKCASGRVVAILAGLGSSGVVDCTRVRSALFVTVRVRRTVRGHRMSPIQVPIGRANPQRSLTQVRLKRCSNLLLQICALARPRWLLNGCR